MADDATTIQDAFRELHRELTNVAQVLKEDRESQGPLLLSQLAQTGSLEILRDSFKQFLGKPARKKESRDAILSGECGLVLSRPR